MKFIEDLKPMRMYSPKTKIYAPVDIANKRKGAAALLLTRSIDESEMIMNLPYIYNPNLFISYYISKSVTGYINQEINNEIDIETNDIEMDNSISNNDFNNTINEALIYKDPISTINIKFDNKTCSIYDMNVIKKVINYNTYKKYMDLLQYKKLKSVTIYCHRDPLEIVEISPIKNTYAWSNENEIHILCESSYKANVNIDNKDSYYKYLESEVVNNIIHHMNININPIYAAMLSSFLTGEYLNYTAKKDDIKKLYNGKYYIALDKLVKSTGNWIVIRMIYKNSFDPLYKFISKSDIDNLMNLLTTNHILMKINEVTREEAIACHGYFFDDRWNSIIAIKDKLYRKRVECLIVNKQDESVYLYFKKDHGYDIPGGAVGKDIEDKDQVRNECKEEARILIKNIKDTNLTYMTGFDEKPLYMKDLPVAWDGNITTVYIAEYDKIYNEYIEDIDKENDMYKLGRFYKIQEIYKFLNPVHKAALMGYLRDNNIKIKLEACKLDIDSSKISINNYIITEDYISYTLDNNDKNILFFNKPEYDIYDEAVKVNTKQDNTILKKFLYKERIRTNRDLIKLYSDVRARNPWIIKTYPTINRYNGFNIYVDFSYYHSLFLKNNIYTNDKGVGIYWDIINRLLDTEEINKFYSKQTIFIPVSNKSWGINNPEDLFNYRVSINPISTILRLLRNNPGELRKWSNKKILFVSEKGFFTVDFGTFALNNLPKFKRFISMLMSFEKIEYEDEIDNTDTPESDSKAVIVSNSIDKIQIATGIELNNNKSIDLSNNKNSIVSGSSIRPMELTKASIKIPIVDNEKNLVYILAPTQDDAINTLNANDNIINKKEIKNIFVI